MAPEDAAQERLTCALEAIATKFVGVAGTAVPPPLDPLAPPHPGSRLVASRRAAKKNAVRVRISSRMKALETSRFSPSPFSVSDEEGELQVTDGRSTGLNGFSSQNEAKDFVVSKSLRACPIAGRIVAKMVNIPLAGQSQAILILKL